MHKSREKKKEILGTTFHKTVGIMSTLEDQSRLNVVAAVSPDARGEKRKAIGDGEIYGTKNKKGDAVTERVKYVMKTEVLTEGVEPTNLCSSHPELFLESLQGNIDLVWCQDGKKEGYIDPFNKAFFEYDRKNPNAVKTFMELKKKTGIFVAINRRISPEVNEPDMKEGNHGGLFKMTYYVRHHGWNNKELERDHRMCLETLAEVSVVIELVVYKIEKGQHCSYQEWIFLF
jgi:hypothetical protein